MDSSDFITFTYLAAAILVFPFCVRNFWREELERASREHYIPSLGVVGATALAFSVFWPLVLFMWVMMGLMQLLVLGIKEE